MDWRSEIRSYLLFHFDVLSVLSHAYELFERKVFALMTGFEWESSYSDKGFRAAADIHGRVGAPVGAGPTGFSF